MKKTIAVCALGASLGLAAPASAATPAIAFDVAPTIKSNSVVPGGFTVGSWSINNGTAGYLPAGTTFRVTFQQTSGAASRAATTVTLLDPSVASVAKVGANDYRVTMKTQIAEGASISGVWSDAHWFNTGDRDKVTINLENVPAGYADTNKANDVNTFDRWGLGF